MDTTALLTEIIDTVYTRCSLQLTDYAPEEESQEYHACQFKLNESTIICRTAKVTPKKVGQFVTFWKRIPNGPIAPFHETDIFDFFVVNIQTENQLGQFVFPKALLIKQGILSTEIKEGKRAFRVYPPWDVAQNKQAQRSQQWQLNYFYTIDNMTDLKRVSDLYHNK